MSSEHQEVVSLAKIWANPAGTDGTLFTRCLVEYEPRATFTCSKCHHVLVGTKSGRLFKTILDSGEIQAVSDKRFAGGIRSVDGCPYCGDRKMYFGTGMGDIFLVETEKFTRQFSTHGRVSAV